MKKLLNLFTILNFCLNALNLPVSTVAISRYRIFNVSRFVYRFINRGCLGRQNVPDKSVFRRISRTAKSHVDEYS